ncbi:MAG: hypothetical protein HQ555_02030 [Candidatus Aminicenantes bacterium]|nr:hypothetical protein [Candidatus Aminicenantes bacterium]
MTTNKSSELDSETHAYNVGVLWSMLLTFEIMLRSCIRVKTGQGIGIPKLDTITEGTILKRTAVIDCNSLANVIQKFNKEFKDLNVSVDEDKIVRLRNALGHGKVLAQEPPFPNPMTIFNLVGIKGEPDKVKVDFREDMTGEWFMSNREFFKKEVKKLRELYNSLIKK